MLDLLRFFFIQRVKGFAPPGAEPFMDEEGSARFKKELLKAKMYLEFGSGGTTILADRANILTTSVENDRFYARAVASQLSNSTVTQIVVNMGLTREWGYPIFPNRAKARAYVTAASLGQTPDFILVDGRYRVACALEVARFLNSRGSNATLMFDDYKGRSHYHSVEETLGVPEMAGRAAIFTVGHQPVSIDAVEIALEDSR